jgi:hypothetical protein
LNGTSVTFPYEISGLPENVWYSVKALDTQNALPGAQVSGVGVSPGTFLQSGADGAQTQFSFALGPVASGPAYSDGSTTLYIVANTPLLQSNLTAELKKGMIVTLNPTPVQPGAPTVPMGTTVQSIGPTNNSGFHFSQYTPQGGVATTVLQVQLNNSITNSSNQSFLYTLVLPVPPLTSKVGDKTQYTLYLGGTPNTSPLTVNPGYPNQPSPYTNTSTVTIPAGSTLDITPVIGSLTSYTQQAQQLTRVKGVVTPSTFTLVNGTLTSGRVDIADGTLAGKGTINGAIDMMGPLSGYTFTYRDPISLKMLTGTIEGTNGGSLLPGDSTDLSTAKPGILHTGDVTMYGAKAVIGSTTIYGPKLQIIAKGATTAGTDYSQLASSGNVSLGNSELVLYRDINYIPKKGDTLTILTAKSITGQFRQGTTVFDTTGAFRFKITYNANSVVLTYNPLILSAPAPAPVGPGFGRR